MADQTLKLSGPVQLMPQGKEQVALELLRLVLSAEPDVKRDRAYYLTLYHECLQVVHDRAPQKKG